MIPGILLLLLSFFPSISHAACSGSGLTWTCTAGSTAGQIQTAVNNSSAGATITFAAGNYSFTGVGLGNKNGVTLICATVGGCNQSAPHPFEMGQDVSGTCGTKTNLTRISGWNFTGVASGGHYFQWYCHNLTTVQVRFDHITMSNIGQGNRGIMLGEESNAVEAMFIGVIDHATFTSTSGNNFIAVHNAGGGNPGNGWIAGSQGTGNCLYWEDSVVTMPGVTGGTFGFGAIDVAGSTCQVVRFNTITGPPIREHSMCHGGPYSMEVYGNIVNSSSNESVGFWDIHMQGSGEITIWGNQVTSGSTPIAVQHYRSDTSVMPQGDCTALQIADGDQTGVGTPTDPNDGNRTPLSSYYGYPAWHQPGRDANAALKPLYAWLNTYIGGSTNAPIAIEIGSWTGSSANCANNNTNRINCHIQLNRDLYQYTASFNGTSGTGSGTLASRPATCTATPDAADAGNGGVGYWATDQGTWKQTTPSQGQDVSNGVLYRCSSTNTWTVAYTPYTYPHPLQEFVGGGSPRNQGMSGKVRSAGAVRFSNP